MSDSLVPVGVLLSLAAAACRFEGRLPPPTRLADFSEIERDVGRVGALDPPAGDESSMSFASRLLPIVEFRVNEDALGLFCLDTGAGSTVLSGHDVARLKLPTRAVPERTFSTVRGSVECNQFVTIDRMNLDGITVHAVDAPVVDTTLPISGCIGAPLLAQYPILFDGVRERVHVLPADDVESVLERLYPGARWTKVPLWWQREVPMVEVSVGSRSLRMFVDTGSATSELEPRMVSALGLRAIGYVDVLSHDLAGEIQEQGTEYELSDLRVGGWSFSFGFDVTGESNRNLRRTACDGTLGYDVLGRIPFVFDAPGGFLWTMDPPSGTDPCIRISSDCSVIGAFDDRLPEFRAMVALAAARSGAGRFAGRVASLLDDPDAEVRAAAAEALSIFAGVSWPSGSRLAEARAWWEEHKGDPEFQPEPGEEEHSEDRSE